MLNKSRYQGQQLMEFSKLMFHQRPKFCRFIKIPKEAHHRQLSDFLLSSFYAPKFSNPSFYAPNFQPRIAGWYRKAVLLLQAAKEKL